MKRRSIICALIFAVSGFAGGAFGQAQTLGSTSYGDVTVSATVNEVVKIVLTGGAAVNLGAYDASSPGSDLTGQLAFCVYSNTSGNAYEIKGSSLNGTGAFEMKHASTADTVTYTVDFDDAGTFAAAAATFSEDIFANNGGSGFAGSSSSTCSTANASIEITAAESGNLDSAPAGNYEDTLTLTVSPI